ncbi:MAG TPA: NAD(P)/FAD-dependent oxidoreductase [Candidatus Krumholzibacteria bacterium]|nr:NAD(P)/FAD-dependent oxidoreductase [Candidatus Krumholzibacteria bacterium]HPD72420.1 NAD(P)/FAD-dependent oxidoreductase [Candidatus Krumholzibacteria bacterium]HRY40648.1 NAD(P)/FAD-dependent oxidoreductase [Candidatus Krumholzibacteria bacterium]
MPDVEVTVIGGGIVGCAVAARAAAAGFATALVERGPLLGGGISSRNSGVAHAGMYYPPGSLKARLCVEGRRLLKTFCEHHGVRYRECGKLVVATSQADLGELERLHALGEANGVEDLRLIESAEVASLAPAVRALAALWSPRSAILDVEGCTRAFGRLAGLAGAQILTGADCVGLDRQRDGWRLEVRPPTGATREGWRHTSRWVVNAAGLYSDRIAEFAGVDIDREGWRLRWVKGNYFAISPRHDGRVERLVYPVPPADGSSLGVHLCLDLAGRMRLGPDVEPPLAPRAAEDYTVDPDRLESFYLGAHRFLPFLARRDLSPDMCGLRPRRIAWWTDGFADFVIRRETGDLEGLVNLVGIESPGVTAAPAIARQVVGYLAGEA